MTSLEFTSKTSDFILLVWFVLASCLATECDECELSVTVRTVHSPSAYTHDSPLLRGQGHLTHIHTQTPLP